MDNKDLNENNRTDDLMDMLEKAADTAKNTSETPNEAPRETNGEGIAQKIEEAITLNAEDKIDESIAKQDEYDIVFSKDVTEDLLSEIFDDGSNKKKRIKPSNKPQKAVKKTKNEKEKTLLGEIFDWVEIIVLSAAFVLVLFTFVMRLAVVDGPSMENTLHDDEMLVISGLFYTPENNDIIVFNSPNFKEPIVKRIIATEGQTVDIDFETWTVVVDGKALQEDYIKRELAPMKNSDVRFPLTVPEGHVFVMGDNRNDSLDSRSSLIGLVDERYILGEVKLRLTPFSKFGKVN